MAEMEMIVGGRALVMGILNVTPDSFSDGGRYYSAPESVRRARNMAEEGADIIDVGGESTRPGAVPLEWGEEWRRIEPVLRELAGLKCKISVDTYHPETAARAVDLGVGMLNCVYKESVPAMLAIQERTPGVEVVVPSAWAEEDPARLAAMKDFYLDPMVGFGTTREEDVELIRSVPRLSKLGRVLVGVSRKRIVKHLTGERMVGRNLGGSVGLALWCVMNGAQCVRVHDVRETVQALKVVEALQP